MVTLYGVKGVVSVKTVFKILKSRYKSLYPEGRSRGFYILNNEIFPPPIINSYSTYVYIIYLYYKDEINITEVTSL